MTPAPTLPTTPMTSWGRLSHGPHTVVPLSSPDTVGAALARQPHGIAYGLGRSYGDVCLNEGGVLWTTTGLDKFIAFDESTGVLQCEAGLVLRDIQRLLVPRGWMLPVTPGTQLITVGGAIANDIHSKNHHRRGTFGEHVRALRLIRTSGEVIDCGPDQARDWFAATVGGLGLTGVIVQATLQLVRVPGPWLETETIPYGTLRECFELADASESTWEHTVSWLDSIGGGGARGIFLRGNATTQAGRSEPSPHTLAVPVQPPVSFVNRTTLRLFNAAYYRGQSWRAGRAVQHYETFFYPLDHVRDWNRLYGPRGLYQYQSVVPRAVAVDAVTAMVRAMDQERHGSFLTVLKTFGDRPAVGMLSFPRDGATLALDFPNAGDRSRRLFDRLDAIVREAGGRLYPAKDARMPRDLFESGYPRLPEFLRFRDPGITSALSRRLMGH